MIVDNPIYERQNLINDLTIPHAATVVGCGGTGFWVVIFLAMSGVEELILVDNDIVEVSNLNRLPIRKNTIGMTKIGAVGDFIARIRDNIRIEFHAERIVAPEDCTLLRGAVFCCTDNLTSQQLICAYCKKNALKYQRVGYDGTVLNVSKTFPLSFEEKETTTGYTQTPSWVIPAVLAAAFGVSSRMYKEICLMDDIGKLNIYQSSFIPEKVIDDKEDAIRETVEEEIRDNICEYIPDDYGYCGECDRVDPEDGWGHCEDCNRVALSDVDVEREDAVNSILSEIASGHTKDPSVLEVLQRGGYIKRKEEGSCEQKKTPAKRKKTQR